MTDKTERDALVLVRRSQLIELQAEVSDDASLAHERIRSILAAQPAASVDVEGLQRYRMASTPDGKRNLYKDDSGAWVRMRDVERLIDSAGGAKGDGDPGEFGVGIAPNPKARYWQERADFWRGQAIALGYDPEATPQPAEGDGAVAPSTDWPAVIEGEDGHEYVPRRVAEQRVWGALKFSEANRPSAAAAVPGLDAGAYFWLARVLTTYGDKLSPSAMAIISERIAAAPAAPKGGVDEAMVEHAEQVRVETLHKVTAYGSAGVEERYLMAMRAALTAALADGEAASA